MWERALSAARVGTFSVQFNLYSSKSNRLWWEILLCCRQCKLLLASERKKKKKKHKTSIPCRAAATASSVPSECKTFQWPSEEMLPSANLRLPRAHDPQRLPLPLPGSVSAHHEALRLHVCQPRRAKGQAPVPHQSPSPASAPLLTHVLIGFSPSVCPRRWRSCWRSWTWIGGASSWAPAGWERLVPTPRVETTCHVCFLLCLAGVHEARRAALPGAAEGPAGHRLAGLPAGLLHGASGPAEISQAEGETLISMPMTRDCTFETFGCTWPFIFFSCQVLCVWMFYSYLFY